MNNLKLQTFFIILYYFSSVICTFSYKHFVTDFTSEFVKSKHAVLFGCNYKDLLDTTRDLVTIGQAVSTINLEHSNYSIENILSRKLYAKTSVVVDCNCKNYKKVLYDASNFKYFNKTYQWLVIDSENFGAFGIFGDIENVALNSQITYVNRSNDDNLQLYDVYSKGRHIKSPIEITLLGKWSPYKKFTIIRDITELQGTENRKKFNGLKLRGVVVIDRENITSNTQVDQLLTSGNKIDGVIPFIKYHYALVGILQQYLNASVDYRVTRGWAERLPNSSFRLGLLGVVKRNEADIAASPAFLRLNRFAEFDNIHQGWLLEIAFIFMYTSKLSTGQGSTGNFIAPFDYSVWIISTIILILIALFWKGFQIFAKRLHIDDDKQYTFGNITLQSIAAICQQGLDPVPKATTSRIIALTLIIFTFVLYNFYTSSVVGGLLNSNYKGPKNLEELVASPLSLSFEDVPYNRVIFKESNLRGIVKTIYNKKIHPKRNPDDLMQFAALRMAIKFIKRGTHGFHCELVGAYDDIAKTFDANEICNLRIIGGLFPVDVVPMIVTKRSQYTEIFKIILHRARELGLVKRELQKARTERPKCQGSLRVEPVTLLSVLNSFYLLGGAMIISGFILVIEIIIAKRKV